VGDLITKRVLPSRMLAYLDMRVLRKGKIDPTCIHYYRTIIIDV
jgi:hypothetical protein